LARAIPHDVTRANFAKDRREKPIAPVFVFSLFFEAQISARKTGAKNQSRRSSYFRCSSKRRSQRIVAPGAGCDELCPLGNSVLPDGLIVVFIPPVAPVAPPVPVPVVVPVVPVDTPLLVPVPTPPVEAPADVPAPPVPCARAADDEIANANPKVIAASFMKHSF
jgi:hypothetical protein